MRNKSPLIDVLGLVFAGFILGTITDQAVTEYKKGNEKGVFYLMLPEAIFGYFAYKDGRRVYNQIRQD